jgi:CRP-like cAMP-binding protein
MKEIPEIFKDIFPISMDSLDRVMAITEYADYSKGLRFIEKDKRNSSEYFLLDGICRSYLLNPEGEEIILNGKIYAPGGLIKLNNRSTNTVQIYDPLSDQWKEGPEMTEVRASFPSCVMNGKIWAMRIPK